MANSTKSAIGVDNRVSSCGKGHFSCFEDNNSQASCSTFTNGFFLGVATVVTTITGPSPMPFATSSETGATSHIQMLPEIATKSNAAPTILAMIFQPSTQIPSKSA